MRKSSSALMMRARSFFGRRIMSERGQSDYITRIAITTRSKDPARAGGRLRLPAAGLARGLCRPGNAHGERGHLLYRGVEQRAVAAQVQLVVENAVVPERGQAMANGPDQHRPGHHFLGR